MLRKRYSTAVQEVLEAMQGARDGREEYVMLDRSILAILNLSPAKSAMARALQDDSVWDSTMRGQLLRFLSGDPQYGHLGPRGRGGFRIAVLLQEAESLAAQERAAVISELHLAKALARSRDGLASLGVNPSALIARVAELEGATVEALCFVLMPFREELTEVYRNAIKPAVEKAGLRCERADEIAAPGVVLDQIDERIQRAQVIVADLTGSNPNVTQELGFARALNKPVILLTQQTMDLPFDVRHYRVLAYRFDDLGLEDLREHLSSALAEILG